MAATADDGFPQLGVCRTRVAKLDADGTIGTQTYVSDALLKATIKTNNEAGDEIKEKNGCGDIYVNFKGADSLLWYDIELEFLTPDPFLTSLLLPSSSLITLTNTYGWAAPTIGAVSTGTVSVELWTKRAKGGAQSATFPYARHALVQLQNTSLGDRTMDSGAQHVVITGQAVQNAGWFDGPDNTWPSDDGAGGYLPNAWKWIPVTSLPNVTVGYATITSS